MRMEIDLGGEKVTVAAKYIVCPRCQGRGVHDCWEGGMTMSEVAEQGPEFMEDYLDGVYDKQCTKCKGQRVLQVMNECLTDPETVALVREYEQEEAEYRAMVAAERRMGC